MASRQQVFFVPATALRRRLLALYRRIAGIAAERPKSLRLCETLSLGERKFVAVVAFEDQRFLLGGTASTVALLSRLEDGGKVTACPVNRDMMNRDTMNRDTMTLGGGRGAVPCGASCEGPTC